MTAETLAQNREKPAIVMRLEQHGATARLAVYYVKEILRSLLIGVRHAMTSPDAEEYSKLDAASAGCDTGAAASC